MSCARAARGWPVLVPAAVLWILGGGCGGGGGGGGAPAVTVVVSPSSLTVLAGEAAQLAATVTGSADVAVAWTVGGAACAAADCGTVSDAGRYAALATPPAADLAVEVRATSHADPGRSGLARVTVPAVRVTVSPLAPAVPLGGARQLTATVTGTRDQGVTWDLSGPGTLGGDGAYRAPDTLTTPAAAVATATSAADPTRSASAAIRIPAVAVQVTPEAATVLLDATGTFTAAVSNAAEAGVDWSLAGAGCGEGACGTIDALGRYLPPPSLAAPLTVQVVATARADPTKSGLATVDVPRVEVSVAPDGAEVPLGGTRTFTATVSHAVATGVTWSVHGPGSMGPDGRYAAPAALATPATVTVTAAAVADPTRTASATVTIPAVTVALAPPAPSVVLGASLDLAATVGNAADGEVAWGLVGPGALAAGRYTAPATLTTPASATVTATSRADPGKAASVTVTIPAVGVSISPAAPRVLLGGTQAFVTPVTNATDTGVTFAVSGDGCAGDGCGAVGPGGLFRTAPHLVTPAALTVTVRPRADPTKSASATVAVPPVVVTLSPASTTMAPDRWRWHVPTVVDAVDGSVTWSVSGAGCAGAACGTVDAEGRYRSPAAPPTPATVSVTATSVADPTKSASSPVTISLALDARLSGEFVLWLRGVELQYDPGAPFQLAARFVADGEGHLLDGLRDLVDAVHPIVGEAIGGLYAVGDDDLGTLTLPPVRTYAFSLQADGEGAFVIDYDHAGLPLLAGVLLRQDPRLRSTARVVGDFAGLLEGGGVGAARVGAVGRLHADGAGGLSAIAFDASDGASGEAWTSAAGSYQVGPGGHGTAVLGLPVATAAAPMSLYVVDADRLLLVSTAPVQAGTPQVSGLLVRQAGGPFSEASLDAAAVFSLQGKASAEFPSVAIGLLRPDGAGGVTGTFEQNEAGTVTTGAPLGGTYQVAPDGRGVLDTDLGRFVLRLTAPNEAVLLEAPGARVRTGRLQRQVGAPFGAALSGRFCSGTRPPATAATSVVTGGEAFDAAAGFARYYVNSAAGPGFGQGSSPYTLADTGRGVVPDPGNAVFWLVSPDELVQLHTAPTTPSHGMLYELRR